MSDKEVADIFFCDLFLFNMKFKHVNDKEVNEGYEETRVWLLFLFTKNTRREKNE